MWYDFSSIVRSIKWFSGLFQHSKHSKQQIETVRKSVKRVDSYQGGKLPKKKLFFFLTTGSFPQHKAYKSLVFPAAEVDTICPESAQAETAADVELEVIITARPR